MIKFNRRILKIKKLILSVLILFCSFVANGWATTFTGSLVGQSTLIASSDWNSSSTVLSWTVDDVTNSSLWTYVYTFSVPAKNISHVIIEVSTDFTANNIFSGTTTGYDGPKTYTDSPNNQGMPSPMWGIKWNSGSVLSYQWTIVTDRAPMWGDFYARNGQEGGGSGIWVYAYNKNFGTDTADPIGNGNAGGWALVPDTGTGVIPEPGTFLLLGTGLLGIAAIRFRRAKK